MGFKQARQAKRNWCISELQNVKVGAREKLRERREDTTNAQDADEVETRRKRYERMFLQFLPSCVLECLSKQKTEGEEQDVPDDMESEEEEEQEVIELET